MQIHPTCLIGPCPQPIVILPVPGPSVPGNGGIVPPWLEKPVPPTQIQPWPLPKG